MMTSQSKVVKHGTIKGWNQMEWTQMDEGQLRILKHTERGKMDAYRQRVVKNYLSNNQHERIRK